MLFKMILNKSAPIAQVQKDSNFETEKETETE